MDADARHALESIRLHWADTPDDVWGTADPFHVGGLHEDTIVDIIRSFDDARRSPSGSPIGVTVRGPAGSGKTHLLGRVRQEDAALGRVDAGVDAHQDVVADGLQGTAGGRVVGREALL